MARVWSSGFELNSTGGNVEFQGIVGAAAIQTTVVRSGTYAGQITSLSSGVQKWFRYDFAAANVSVSYHRFYFRVDTYPSAENRFFALLSSTGTTRVYLTISSTGTLQLYDEDGAIGSPSAALSTATWYRIEVGVDVSAASGSHVVTARIDGTNFATASNRAITTGVARPLWGGNVASEAQTTGNWYFDDIAINDNTGSFQNSWPGEGNIVHLRPNGDGDNTAWTNTYTQVDEVTPDDATTLISTTTDEAIEDMTIDDTPIAIASGDTINLVSVGFRFNVASATDPDPNVVVRIKAAPAGTVEESAEITAGTSAWNTNATAVPRNHPLTLYDLPGASTTAWTKADLDTAQIGVRCSVNDTDALQVTAMWLLVDFTPAPPASSTIKKLVGVAQASIKTVAGVAEASVKKVAKVNNP